MLREATIPRAERLKQSRVPELLESDVAPPAQSAGVADGLYEQGQDELGHAHAREATT